MNLVKVRRPHLWLRCRSFLDWCLGSLWCPSSLSLLLLDWDNRGELGGLLLGGGSLLHRSWTLSRRARTEAVLTTDQLSKVLLGLDVPSQMRVSLLQGAGVNQVIQPLLVDIDILLQHPDNITGVTLAVGDLLVRGVPLPAARTIARWRQVRISGSTPEIQ